MDAVAAETEQNAQDKRASAPEHGDDSVHQFEEDVNVITSNINTVSLDDLQ